MGTYVTRDKAGAPFIFDIKGEAPSQTEMARITNFLATGQTPQAATPAPAPAEDQPGIMENFAANIAQGFNESQAGVDFMIAGIQKELGDTKDAEEWEKAGRAQLAERDTYKVRDKGFLEEEGIYGKAASLAGTVGRTGAAMVGGIGSTLAGGAIGTAIGGPAGTIIGAGLGLAAGTAAYAPQMMSANAERQIKQHGFIKDYDKAFAATGAQAAVESITDRLTLGLAKIGFTGGKAALKTLGVGAKAGVKREVVDKSVKQAMTIAAKRIGLPAAFGAVSGASEEVLQQGLERWQAELPLLDDKAKDEYIESAIVGGILEGVFGAGAGVYGHRKQAGQERRIQQAKDDLAAEHARVSQQAATNYPAHMERRGAKYDVPPPSPDEKEQEVQVAGALPDFSAETREQKLLNKDEILLPPGLREDETGTPPSPAASLTPEARQEAEPLLAPETPQGPVQPLHSETEYRGTIDTLRNENSISVDKIASTMKLPRPKAQAIYDEMLRRNDAHPAGSQNQYARITVPTGMATREASNVTGKVPPRVSRDYMVQPVRPANQKPFAIEISGKKKGTNRFQTSDEALAWIEANIKGNQKKNAAVVEDTSGQQFGIYRLNYEHLPNREQRLIGKEVVNTFATQADAEAAIKDYDPAYSPETNRRRQEGIPVEEKQAAIEADEKTELGPIADQLRKVVNRVVGPGRAEVDLVPRLDATYMRQIGLPEEANMLEQGAVAEGFVRRDPKRLVQNVMALAGDLASPNLTEDQRTKLIEDVVNHELIHLIRNLDLLTKSEWDQLFRLAAKQKVPGKEYTWLERSAAQHAKKGPNTVVEEAIAEMFRQYIKDPTTFRNPERGLFKKLADFIKRLVGLGKRHDAQDLMDTIFEGGISQRDIGSGGMGPRGKDDIFFSLLKNDNFYLKSARFIDAVKQEKAPAAQWKGMLKNAGIKQEEANWLGLDEWLDSISKDGPVDKRDIQNFIAANEGIKVRVLAHLSHPELGKAGQRNLGRPQYKDLQTRGGTDYAEAVFFFDQKPGEPIYDQGHFDQQDNVVAHARFKTVMENGKKILFIEEIQSDLHQQAGKVGGYYSASLKQDMDEAWQEYETLKVVASRAWDANKEINNQIGIKSGDARVLKMRRVNRPDPATDEAYRQVNQELADLLVASEQAQQALKQTSDASAAKYKEWARIQKRINIPNAPFKTGWEDYVIKRMIRHAVENGFDGIAWHGSPESVAATESWMLETKKDEKGLPSYTIGVDSDGKPINVTPIINRYLEKLPRIVRKLAGKFGVEVDIKNASENFVAPIGARGSIYTPPPLNNAEEIMRVFPTKGSIRATLARMQARQDFDLASPQHTQEMEDQQDRLINRFKIAQQVAYNQRDYNPDAAFQAAMLDRVDLRETLIWTQPNGQWIDVIDARKMGTTDPNAPIGSFPFKHFRADFNMDMREGFERGDVSMFSMLEPPDTVPQYNVSAPMGQRVPLTPPANTLNNVYTKVTYDNLARTIRRFIDKTGTGPGREGLKEAVDTGIIAMQDRMLSVGRLIDEIKKNGGFVSNENDTYLRETLFSGQTDAELKANEREYYKPLEKAINDLSVTRRDYDEIYNLFGGGTDPIARILKTYPNHKHAMSELYLYAQHAQERNAEMRRRNVKLQNVRPLAYDYGSGLEDFAAQQILNWYAAKPFGREFNDLTNPNSIRSRMRAIIKNTNDVRVHYGLNPDFRVMNHPDGRPANPYEDYVPIRGWIEDQNHLDPDVQNFIKAGKGFNIRGKEDFSALGREDSLGRNLIAEAMKQNQEAVVRGNKNRVGQSFRQLILDNPVEMARVAEIMHTPRTKYAFVNGVVRQVVDNRMVNDPSVLKVKVDGQQVYIKIHNERIARALGGASALGNVGMNPLLKGLTKLNRILAALRTSYNPEFVISNMLRDLEAAMVNLTEHEQKGLRRKVIGSVFPALNGIRKAIRKEDMNSEWAKTFEEYKRHGGMTAFYGIRDLEDTINRINKEFAQDTSGATHKVLAPLKALAKFADDYNTVVENGTRLATYKALRDEYLARSGDPTNPANQNRAREMAAFAAKNLTVNFNMGGEQKPTMQALYLFYNAGMQGSMALLNPFIRSKKMRYMWGAVLTAGAVQDMMMSMLSPEDDDGEKRYDKIPDHVLEHNWVFMDPFGMSERGYFKIPQPYLFNGIYNMGRMLSKTARGKATLGDLTSSGGMTLLDSLNPFGTSNNLVNFGAPSVFDPIVDHYLNQDFTGSPIVPEGNPFSESATEIASQRYWTNTNPAYVTISDYMSKLTGRKGDYLPGYVEVSPNKVEYAVEFLTGGVGPFMARAAWLAGAATGATPFEMTAADIPFARKVYGSVTEKNDLQNFIEGRDKVLRVRNAMRDARREHDPELYKSIVASYPSEAKIANKINAIENARKKFSTKIKKIRDNPKLSDERKEQVIKSLKERQNKLVGQGNEVLSGMD